MRLEDCKIDRDNNCYYETDDDNCLPEFSFRILIGNFAFHFVKISNSTCLVRFDWWLRKFVDFFYRKLAGQDLNLISSHHRSKPNWGGRNIGVPVADFNWFQLDFECQNEDKKSHEFGNMLQKTKRLDSRSLMEIKVK